MLSLCFQQGHWKSFELAWPPTVQGELRKGVMQKAFYKTRRNKQCVGTKEKSEYKSKESYFQKGGVWDQYSTSLPSTLQIQRTEQSIHLQ